ncbi:peptidase inhibitor family I36 protein [Streptomyces sp. TRM 70361]|uniref:peptidase inhibitor family I36 protein n=1 Tax=Streptomyces sp. TRM 70361 TaxID=3116553 RepID=UPI002E7ABC5C|nr:peptidase inhibitor family I36 protein [Streptomyces sp. TRM 70361]MEE1943292.1 peptidase inhibitor family I36 protein [Streptomyces sp. TRM 70361]
MRKTASLLAALSLAGLAAVAVPQSASAAAPVCPNEHFCANTDANFAGMQVSWYGDDGFWESNINNQDSAWANRGTTSGGQPARVKVYDGYWQSGAVTICVPPASYVFYDEDANDRGSSHTWTHSC